VEFTESVKRARLFEQREVKLKWALQLLISGLCVDCGRKAGKHSASGLADGDVFWCARLPVTSDDDKAAGPFYFLYLKHTMISL
jgi:hypothetical protein